MNNYLREENSRTYKGIFLNAFPKALEDDVIVVLNILPFDVDAAVLIKGQTAVADGLILPSELTVRLNSDVLNIPSRIYFNEPDPGMVNQLTCTQTIILHCIYLRHHNGYLRQSRLEKLAGFNDAWIVPHTLQLLGEYVLEILQVLNGIITDENIQYYRQFIKENPGYWQRTVSRMISYWDCYYRRKYFQNNTRKMFPGLDEYPGKQIVDRLENRLL